MKEQVTKAPQVSKASAYQASGQVHVENNSKAHWKDGREEALAQLQLKKALQMASQKAVGMGIVQRSVDLNGETDPTEIWKQVGPLVTTRYRRKQTLFAWAGDGDTRDYTSAQDLADDLDLANRKGGKMGRNRPDWAPNLTTVFNQTHGGTWHRRHIIMSSHMRAAVYAVTDANDASEVLVAYNKLTGLLGITASDVAQAEANLVYLLHNNPANLVIDQGDWNSGIGAYAHNIDQALKGDLDALFTEYQTNGVAFLSRFVKGFQPAIQEQIGSFWVQYLKSNPAKDKEELTDVLTMMYDNAAVDIMSTQSMPQQDGLTGKLLALQAGFANAANGNLSALETTSQTYINLGKDIGARLPGDVVVKYADVL